MAGHDRSKRITPQRLSNRARAAARYGPGQVGVSRNTSSRDAAHGIVHTHLKIGKPYDWNTTTLAKARSHNRSLGKRATGVKEVWVGNPWGTPIAQSTYASFARVQGGSLGSRPAHTTGEVGGRPASVYDRTSQS